VKDTGFLSETLGEIARAGRERSLRAVTPLAGMRVSVGVREAVDFCSNDYLGLARDARVREAAARAARELGAGSGSARLITGTRDIHLALEDELAALVGAEGTLLFGAGYLAGVGILPALAGPGDVVFSDALNHACLIDGCRLSRAEVVVLPHRDTDALEDRLRAASGFRRRVVVTESVFSMDGDRAPLARLADLCDRHDALLVVDEAHAIGVVGDGGLARDLGLAGRIDVVLGTLGKALGAYGAFAAGSRPMVRFLMHRARPFLFQTALPPPTVAAARASLSVMREDPSLRARLTANADRLRAALGFRDHGSAIFPIVLGDEADAMAASARLLEVGFLVQGIRPPTVPPGTSRLRVTVSAAHEPSEIDGLAAALARIVPARGNENGGAVPGPPVVAR
jgi:8-amino-7-oxononanoate synthase